MHADDDPSKRDLYEDQVPPHAPAVPGNGSADEADDDEKAANDGDQADAQ